jgi:hypothetical protein
MGKPLRTIDPRCAIVIEARSDLLCRPAPPDRRQERRLVDRGTQLIEPSTDLIRVEQGWSYGNSNP